MINSCFKTSFPIRKRSTAECEAFKQCPVTPLSRKRKGFFSRQNFDFICEYDSELIKDLSAPVSIMPLSGKFPK